jgi:hypothetical protein
VSADQRDRATQHSDGRRQVEQRSHRYARQVLQDHVRYRDREQHHQWFAARQQVLETGVDADGCKDINEQNIASGKVEFDWNSGNGIDDSVRRTAAPLSPVPEC